ncbi:coenzyme F420-0:L-glutamate ligase [Desulfitibacter alkalitolerans]|uniref:coenzyme F420-0:L-glutamate ligase n=1 Tax=Desulfitibacter alkalitolerans TaxID=264641 RepID=UPI000686381E|nr:coenzyme F420-0:L-glutamate ligase [Desulfitibacter alkalitolerans]
MTEKVKNPLIKANEKFYLRIPIKTHVLSKEDSIVEAVQKYTVPILQEGDIVFVSEKATAITQGRAIKLVDIKPRFLATFLSKYVKKVSYGIGLGMPETMEMAFREVGTLRILLAAVVSAIGKLFGRSGDFYRIAGRKVAMIDGPTPYTLPPYNQYVVLGPEDPYEIVNNIAKQINAVCAIVDVNDIGSEVIALSNNSPLTKGEIAGILKDNPLGQGSQQTPMGIIRLLGAEESFALSQVSATKEE